MNQYQSLLLTAISGTVFGAVLVYFMLGDAPSTLPNQQGSDQPLYWVAPMDPNFRRDSPGKSPMGMELVPFYANKVAAESGPGTVFISPHVVNNLGVRSVNVKMSRLDTEIVTVGYVQYDEEKLVHVHPRVEGWIDELYVKTSGEAVKKGDPLYALYSPELVNAQEEYLIALSRSNQLLMDAALTRLRALQLSDEVIQELRQSRKVLQKTIFYSPQTGVVDNLNIREGFYVKPGTKILSIGSLDEVWVEAEVFERQSSLVRVGDAVLMSLNYVPGREWQGRVDYIYPTVDAETRTIRLRMRFSNTDHLLKPNMYAQVVISTGSLQQVLLVPNEALIRTARQERVVLDLGDGQFKSVEVKTGQRGPDAVEIVKGLRLNDRVVVSAQFLLDSESSRSSDFKRMYSRNEAEVSTATVNGRINAIDIALGVVNLSREAIPEWNRGPATVDFDVSRDIDLSSLSLGENVRFTFEVFENTLTIISFESLEVETTDPSKKGGGR
ncbi:MAG: Cu(I)/Ag(I) efflux system membrane fusion protein [Candidatus Azotimanducaceae bacterium]|jgi:Cu(I)/Ag(I) efflux system membrane fusion protein